MSAFELYLALFIASDEDWLTVQSAFWRSNTDVEVLHEMAAKYGIEVAINELPY